MDRLRNTFWHYVDNLILKENMRFGTSKKKIPILTTSVENIPINKSWLWGAASSSDAKHTAARAHPCPLCWRIFANTNSLQSHMSRQHRKPV